MVRVVYFSTQNRLSPFVALIGDWPSRAAMVQTCRAGIELGWRKARPSEIEILEASTRHVALRWRTLREFLWSHRTPELAGFYPGILAMVRKYRCCIKENLRIVRRKAEKEAAQRATEKEISEAYKARVKRKPKQLSLFNAA